MSNELPEIDFKKPVWILFPEKKRRAKAKRCTECDKPIKDASEFKDTLSLKEYSISGLCMRCQDIFYG